MSRETLWRLIDTVAEKHTGPNGEEVAFIAMSFESDGKAYCVSVTGPARMTNHDFINACRAAEGMFISTSGGDPAQVGASVERVPGDTVQ